jgi:amidase
MALFDDYDDHDALGLAELVRSGEVSAETLVETCIARIEALDPELNAIVHPLYQQARAAAAEGEQRGPFAGVPFLLKDLIQTVAGVPTVSGSRFYKGWVPMEDTLLYRRYRDAGLITVAKTATPELGLQPVTEPDIFGPTCNPWDLSRTSGGSSGGTGAAVAARIAPMGHGGDGGGSIRIPAACCGIFGLKPTRARTPIDPASEAWNGFAIEHVLSVSVRDSAAALDATEGEAPHAPYHAPHHEGTFLAATKKDPRALRIAFHSEPAMPSTVHADCRDAVTEVVRLLEDLGHEVIERPPMHEPETLARHFFTVVAANTAAEIREAEAIVGRRATAKDFETATWLSAMMARNFSGEDFVVALRSLQDETRRLTERYRDFDVVLTPTLGQPPVEHYALRPKGAEAAAQKLIARSGARSVLRLPGLLDKTVGEVFDFIPFTPVANFTGQPSMNVPLVWNDQGLPIGTMFTGRFGDEATLFSLAAQLEKARPWRDRKPPTCA